MSQRLKAVYHEGAFVPQAPCDVPEDSEVELIIQGPYLLPPKVLEPDERQHILKTVVERMRQNPLPAGAPRLTRDALHERR
jgi:hypothetical protein